LQALALQIGSEVSYNELAILLGIDKKTVANYVRILEQAFIIFPLRPFSRNLRNELKKLRKIYFVDTGIRNCVFWPHSAPCCDFIRHLIIILFGTLLRFYPAVFEVKIVTGCRVL